ncbi:unnamed protein product [Sympodiomycopsis kandeliae]
MESSSPHDASVDRFNMTLDKDAIEDDYLSDDSSASSSCSSSSSSISRTPIIDEGFLPRILSLFFTIFHSTEGPKVVYQVPEDSVTKRKRTKSAVKEENLFDFNTLSDYLIPKSHLCGRLITCTTKASVIDDPSREKKDEIEQQRQEKQYKVLSYPVLIEDSEKYERNTFIFNLAFVFDGKADVKSYEPVVRKCARALRGLEESFSFLSSPIHQPRMYGVVEQLFQDLNSYCESFISLPDAPHTKYLKKQQNPANNANANNSNMEAALAQARLKEGLSSSMSKSFSRSMLGHRAFLGGQTSSQLPNATSTIASSSSSSPSASPRSSRPGSPTNPVFTTSPPFEPTGPPSATGSTGMSPIQEASGLQRTRTGSSPSLAPVPLRTASARSPRGSFSQVGSFSMVRSGTDTSASASISGVLEGQRRGSGGAGIRRGSGESSNAGMLSGGSMRPVLSRAKTTSTAAVNEAKVSSLPVSSPPTAEGSTSGGAVMQAAAMQRAVSGSSTSSTSSSMRMSELRRALDTSEDGPPSIEAIAADLGSSLASLKTVDNNNQASGSTATLEGNDLDAIGASMIMPKPASSRVGTSKEAPHGLGRTVKEAINLKLFPTYANPPPVHDWDVPVSLLDLGRRERSGGVLSLDGDVSSNWDLTMRSIYPYVDGINHVKRISQLADADLELTRQCMEHLLYYGCVIMVDIFQFFNIYTLKPSIARMAEDVTIQLECGPYVTRPGYVIPCWPVLLDLYTALRPGMTLDIWIEEKGVETLGIDPRRFITFGIIKGFLKRVHRYPVLMYEYEESDIEEEEEEDEDESEEEEEEEAVKEAEKILRNAQIGSDGPMLSRARHLLRNQQQETSSSSSSTTAAASTSTARRLRRQVPARSTSAHSSHHHHHQPTATVSDTANLAFEDEEPSPSPPIRPAMSKRSSSRRSQRAKRSQGPGSQDRRRRRKSPSSRYPSELPYLLDGNHCEDELCVQFGIPWMKLRRMLVLIGRRRQQQQQSHQSRQADSSQVEREDWPMGPLPLQNASGFDTHASDSRVKSTRRSSLRTHPHAQGKRTNSSSGFTMVGIGSHSSFANNNNGYDAEEEEYDREEDDHEDRIAQEMEQSGDFGDVALLFL